MPEHVPEPVPGGVLVLGGVHVLLRGVVFRFHTETSTGRPKRRTSTSTRELDLAVSDRRAAVGPRV